MPTELLCSNDRPFKIAQITDLHMDSAGRSRYARRTMEFIGQMLGDEKPDLTVMTGDLALSYLSGETFEYFCRFMDEHEARWAFCYGNHDRQLGVPGRALEDIMAASKQCIFERGPLDICGDGNYCIEIKSPDGKIYWVLYIMDSCCSRNGEDRQMDHSQVAWYRHTRDEYSAKTGGARSLMFVHVPLHEYAEMYETEPTFGVCYEGISPLRRNPGLFAALMEDDGMRGVFCGHDHVNDLWGEHRGIRLCYGRASGYGTDITCSYGREGLPRGARMILLGQDRKQDFETYIYQDDGSRLYDQPRHEPSEGADK